MPDILPFPFVLHIKKHPARQKFHEDEEVKKTKSLGDYMHRQQRSMTSEYKNLYPG